MTPATSGPTLLAALAHYDPEGCCWKTSGVMFPSDWPMSSQTCPAWGMTRRGELFELPTPALPTAEPASSSSLPTPVVNDMGAAYTPETWDAWTARMQEKHSNGKSLSIEAQRLLPTPVADHSRGLAQSGTDYASLPNAVIGLLPTPRARDWKDAGPSEAGRRRHSPPIVDLLPTPTAQAAKHSSDDRGPGTLDDFNLWTVAVRPDTFLPASRATRGGSATETTYLLNGQSRSGEPTNPQSADGSASQDGQLPGQLSLDATGSD